MGMRVGGSGAAWSAQSASVGKWQQRQQDFKALTSALTTGDLGAAQKAYATLESANGTAKSNSPMAAIGQALQNGDLAGAQKAAAAMQNNRLSDGKVSKPNQALSSVTATNNSIAAMLRGLGSSVDVSA
jgi:hypothetical protein